MVRPDTTRSSTSVSQAIGSMPFIFADWIRVIASAHKFGQDHFVACASYLTMALWHVGFVDQARMHSERAIEYARSLGHSNTLQFALAYGGAYFAALCRDLDYLQSTSAELLEIGKAHVSPSWSAAATGLHGKLLIEQGRTSEGITTLQAGIEALRKRRSTLWQPAFCAWLAEAHAANGEVSQGLAALAMGRQAAAGGAHWLDAELQRVEGELLLAGPLADIPRGSAFSRGSRRCQSAGVQHAGIAHLNEPCAAVAEPRAGRRSARSPHAGPWLVHRRLRRHRSERGKGAARRLT